MSFVCWYSREVGSSGKGTAIRKVGLEVKPVVFSLVETKHSKISDRLIRKWWGGGDCSWCDVVANEGNGGLICMWDEERLSTSGIQKGARWICIRGELKLSSFKCTFVSVYAFNADDGSVPYSFV